MGRIAVVNYGMGNIGSVANALNRLDADYLVTDHPAALGAADAIILPGVGAFSAAMANIRARSLDGALHQQVIENRKPFLGICLGLQLVARDSVELQFSTGLGWIDGHVLKLEPAGGRPVPHVGWNEVEFRPDSPLFEKIPAGGHFFFDHSYYLSCPPALTSATCEYGGHWVAAIEQNNILAVQFHPEKSQRNGLRLLRNFLNLAAAHAHA